MRRVVVICLLLAAAPPASAHAAAPSLYGLQVSNGSTPFAGDGRLLTTVSPNGDGFRDAAHVRFRLAVPAKVALAVVQTDTVTSDPEASSANVIARIPARAFARGWNELLWTPRRDTPPRTYVLQLTVTTSGGRRVYGVARPKGPVVRIQGIEAGFLDASYAPGQEAAVVVATDARRL